MSDSKPISEARLAANRENAKRSSGPRTPEGKARSSQNAVKHGFRSASFCVVRLEDLDEIEKLKADAVACYRPVNSQELVAVERIAIAQQQIFRGGRLDAGMFTSAMNEVLDRTNRPILPMDPDMVGDGDIEITRQQNRNYCIAEGFRRIAKESNAIGLTLRYRAQAEREYRRAVEDFDRLKALRAQPATRAGVVGLQTKSYELPNEPNVGLEPPEPEDIQPIEELNWELPHIRYEQQKKANLAIANEASKSVPNEPNAAVPNEPNSVPDTAVTLLPPNALSSPQDLTSADPALPAEPACPSIPPQSLPVALPNLVDPERN
jgi:hypothetical protein